MNSSDLETNQKMQDLINNNTASVLMLLYEIDLSTYTPIFDLENNVSLHYTYEI